MTESDLRSILGENVKRHRNFKGFSQAKLAELLDISPNFISDIETGKRWLSSDTLVNLADALAVEVHVLLRPRETPADEFSAFVREYTGKAVSSASAAITRCLDELRRQYLE
jgi:transcriptional regulator with XRE-family HTH domain